MKTLLQFTAIIITIAFAVRAQVLPAVTYSISVSDNATGHRELFLGIDPAATDTIDLGLGELEVPPLPPSGTFEARFFLPQNNYNGSLASYTDYRNAALPFTGTKEYRVFYQKSSAATTISIHWSLPSMVTGQLRDVITGTIINVPMAGTGFYTVTNPTSINRLKILLTYTGVNAQPIPPQLIAPLNNAVKSSTKPIFQWSSIPSNSQYQFLLATDTLFSNTVFNDSLLTGTSLSVSNLSEQQTYFWQVRSSNAFGYGRYSSRFKFTTGINPPDSLTAVAINKKTNKLQWKDRSTVENSFTIERKTGDSLSANNYIVVGTAVQNSNQFVDTLNLLDTTKYTYRIKAVRENDSSLYSNLATVITPIPVELLSFSATLISGQVFVSWVTATESNNMGFYVETSQNEIWETKGFIAGHGTTTEMKEYTFSFTNNNPGKTTLRLRQVDYSGTSTILGVEEIENSTLPSSFNVAQNYPNPFNPRTTITFSVPSNGFVAIKVYSPLGEFLEDIGSGWYNAGIHSIHWDASKYSTGIFICKLDYGAMSVSNKMIYLK